MRRALTLLGATGAGLAVLLRYHSGPPDLAALAGIGSERVSSSQGPAVLSTTSTTTASPSQATIELEPQDDDEPLPTVPTTQPPAPPTTAPGQGATTRTATGTAIGPVVTTRFGNVQVQVTEENGTITAVVARQLPGPHARSSQISNFAESLLRNETLTAQSARIDAVSGATITSEAYASSLQGALDQLG